jgi:hypothetical protein
MSRKNIAPIEGQDTLFETEHPADREYMGTGTPHISDQAIEPGPHVDIDQRAENLRASLLAMGKLNQRIGFGYAASTRPLSSEIWGRYQSNTPAVVEGARDKADEFAEEVRRKFWEATGYTALRGTRFISEEGLRVSAQRDWRDFTHQFSHPDDRQKRDKYKRKLAQQIKQLDKPSHNIAA